METSCGWPQYSSKISSTVNHLSQYISAKFSKKESLSRLHQCSEYLFAHNHVTSNHPMLAVEYPLFKVPNESRHAKRGSVSSKIHLKEVNQSNHFHFFIPRQYTRHENYFEYLDNRKKFHIPIVQYYWCR